MRVAKGKGAGQVGVAPQPGGPGGVADGSEHIQDQSPLPLRKASSK